jgi:perosamine synthetase
MADAANPALHLDTTTPGADVARQRPAPPAEPARRTFLPFHQPWIDEDEIAEVVDTLRSGWLTMGPKTLRFEEEFAAYVGAKHAVALNSCTSALHLALDAIGIGPGDEVITSTYTFTATAAVILHLGARPVLVDVQPDTLTLDPAQVAAHVRPSTRAIVPVHMAGAPCDLDPLLELAGRHQLRIVEDSAHVLPGQYKGRVIGSIGDMTAFSFYATKNITTGEGGMITTESAEYADRLRVRRLHGISRDAWKRYTSEGSWYYEVEYPGYKYNLTDLAAALGLQQLRRADRFHAIRSHYASLYRRGLADLPELILPQAPPWGPHSWHLYVIQLDLDRLAIDRSEFIRLLRAENIGTSVHFIPIHLHPYYRERFGYTPAEFPNALRAYQRAISLPLYPRMSESDVEDVVRAVRSIVERHRVRRSA